MNKELRKRKYDINNYHIRLWNGTCFIENEFNLDCILQRNDDDELFCFGIQTNLCDDSKDEKIVKLCKEIEEKIRELHEYLERQSL